jgi:hypothetical protein
MNPTRIDAGQLINEPRQATDICAAGTTQHLNSGDGNCDYDPVN